jgi:hypothetical protein
MSARFACLGFGTVLNNFGSLCRQSLRRSAVFLFGTQTQSGDSIKATFLEIESGKSSQNDEPISNTDDPILSVSLRTTQSCPFCYWNEPCVCQKVHFVQCRWSPGLGGNRRIRRLLFRSFRGVNYRQGQIIRDLCYG